MPGVPHIPLPTMQQQLAMAKLRPDSRESALHEYLKQEMAKCGARTVAGECLHFCMRRVCGSNGA